MGRKLQTFRLKWSVYAIHLALILATGLVYGIFQYTRDFFTMYRSINNLFSALQMICLALILGTLIILFVQFRRAGSFTFYTNALVDNRRGETYYYNDIMTYYFLPANNKNAKSLQFELDNGQIGELTALLPARAFELLQEQHAKIWVPFLKAKLDAHEILTFKLHDDLTSFKILGEQKDQEVRQISISHEGLVLYDHFYKWEEISRYEVSFTGMLSFKDQAFKTVWLEPIVSIDRYYALMTLIANYIDNVDAPGGLEAKRQRFSAQRLLEKLEGQGKAAVPGDKPDQGGDQPEQGGDQPSHAK